MKFVPELEPEVFKVILTSNPEFEDEKSLFRTTFEGLWDQVEKEIFEYDGDYQQLNFPEKGGVTAYFSRNMTDADLARVKEFLKERSIDILNTRAFKTGDNTYLITVGSISTEGSASDVEFDGCKFDIMYGEFSPYLEEMNKYLNKAL